MSLVHLFVIEVLMWLVRSSDIWAIGCILFQMLAGRPPFKGGSEYLTLEQVKRLEYVIPEGFDSSAAELVGQILVSIHKLAHQRGPS